MNVLLIGYSDPEAYYAEYQAFFERAADISESKPTIKYTLIEDLVISVGDDEFSIFDTRHRSDLAMYQLIIIRGRGGRRVFGVPKAISSYAKYKRIPVVNDYSDFRDSSKLTQAVQFFELGQPVARCVYVTPAVLDEKSLLGLDFPCIMKAVFGAHGEDNYLIKSMAEARQVVGESPDLDFVLQRFIPNNNDYRLLIIGDAQLVIRRSAAEGSHLNNTSQGGQATLADADELPKHIIDGARSILKRLGMTFAGVDVLADKHTGEFFFLEVNSQPQIMSGSFVSEKTRLVGKFFDSLDGGVR